MDSSAEPQNAAQQSLAFPLGAAMLVLVVVAVATFLIARNDSPTEVDVGSPEPDVEEPIEQPADNGDTSPGTTTDVGSTDDVDGADEAGHRLSTAGFGADDAAFGEGPSNIVHNADGFASLRQTSDGFVARRSADGVTWTDTPTVGLTGAGGNIFPRGLVVDGGGFVAILEEYPEFDELNDEPFFFEQGLSPTYHLATSPDLAGWTTTILPVIEVESEYGASVQLVDFAVNDARLAALFSVYRNPPNEMRLLFEAGILTEDDFESYCGLSWESFESGEAVNVYLCDFRAEEERHIEFEARMAAAASDEERAEIEREFEELFEEPERTEVAQIEPGTELYRELSLAFTGEEFANVETRVIAGPVGGPYIIGEVDLSGQATSVEPISGGFLALANEFERGSAQTLRSPDGLSWSGSTPLASEEGIYQLAASGDFVVASGSDRQGAPLVYVSTDGGSTWSTESFADGLFGAWVNPISGPAGVAAWVEGATEPYPEYPGPIVNIEKEGFRLSLDFAQNLVILVTPDGRVSEYPELDAVMEGAETDVARRDESSLTFLDPESGDDLISFTEEEIESGFVEVDEPEFVEPPRVRQVHFSSDGSDWARLDVPEVEGENSFMQLVAVGDDEVLLTVTTYLEPPAELWDFEEEGREPTDAEIAALDAWFEQNDGGSRIEWIRLPIG